jgi:hypothetical protein
MSDGEMILCPKCDDGRGRLRPRADFYSHPKTTTGVRTPCKDCIRARDGRTARPATARVADGVRQKRCPTCGEWKPAEGPDLAFYVNLTRPDGLHGQCKSCHRAEDRARAAARPPRRRGPRKPPPPPGRDGPEGKTD